MRSEKDGIGLLAKLELLIGFAFWKTFYDLKSVNLLIVNDVIV